MHCVVIEKSMTKPQKFAHTVGTHQNGIAAGYVDPDAEELWVDECERRSIAFDQGKMLMIDADEVMRKYSK